MTLTHMITICAQVYYNPFIYTRRELPKKKRRLKQNSSFFWRLRQNHSLHGSAELLKESFEQVPPRNPLTDLHKFGTSDYVGDATQYPKWHVNRFRRETPTKG